MSFIPKTASPPQQASHLATPAHMLAKLAWEIGQFKRLLEGREPLRRSTNIAYSAFNAAVTACHCGDWAWRSAGVETSNLADRFGFRLVQDEQRDLNAFLNAVAADCRAIRICGEIANGSKHMGESRTDPRAGARVFWDYGQRDLPTRLVVRDVPGEIDAEHVLESAFDYWKRLFRDIGYIEDRLVGPN